MDIKALRARSAVFIVVVTALVATRVASEPIQSALTVHEWGTFTSIAGDNGAAVRWRPQDGRSDLPGFVVRDCGNLKRSLSGTVRMETPVLYFYAQNKTTVQVRVRFLRGTITEWFPRARVAVRNPASSDFEGTLAWTDVNVLPDVRAEFPVEPGSSHYYKARQTDASPLQSGSVREKFLFYRGVGDFAPPMSARIARDGKIAVWSAPDQRIGDVMLFENRDGAISCQIRHETGDRATFDLAAADPEGATPRHDLVRILTANGLYQREAEAMVDTWSDSWFEEGTRLFYVVPPAVVDAILPLTIDPMPNAITRVFIGRLELVTAATRAAVRQALAAGDRVTLEKFGRFLEPIGARILADALPAERAVIQNQLNIFASRYAAAPSSCR